jgi:hypothetical protein
MSPIMKDAAAKSSGNVPAPRLVPLPVTRKPGSGPDIERGPMPPPPARRASQDRRVFQSNGEAGAVEQAAAFIADYVVLPPDVIYAVACWVAGVHVMDYFDRYPHLSINSPDIRCGKSTLLEVLRTIVPRPLFTANLSPPYLYRSLNVNHNTLLIDEAQFLARRGNESSSLILELLSAGITKSATVGRCTGKNWDKQTEFKIYSGKVYAMNGTVPGVLADRSLTVYMQRKTFNDACLRLLSRVVEPRGQAIHDALAAWAEKYGESLGIFYQDVEEFDIDNDRMADLLRPLQAIAQFEGQHYDLLEAYARRITDRDKEQSLQSIGTRLLAAIREAFSVPDVKGHVPLFYPTADLLEVINQDETFKQLNYGKGLGPESLRGLLDTYRDGSGSPISSVRQRGKKQTRGFYREQFVDAWDRYLPPLPGNPSTSSNPTEG